jgi:predicted ATPase
MLSRIEVLHYKALKYVNVELMNFNILIGPNGSGKSTFIDVINLVKDILNDGPQNAIEKRSSRFEDVLWLNSDNKFEIALEFKIPNEIKEKLKNKKISKARYEILIKKDEKEGIVIGNENLWLIEEQANGRNGKGAVEEVENLFPSERKEPGYVLVPDRKRIPKGWRKIVSKSSQGNDTFKSETSGWNIVYKFGPKKSSLARLPEDSERFPVSLWVKNILMDGIEFLQLNSNSMKWPCSPDLPVSFLPDGSNIPKVVYYLKKHHKDNFNFWVKHIQSALPEVEEVKIKEKEENRFLFISLKYKNGLEIPSWTLSDGTLRLMAQTIIPYLPVKNKIYMIEEPENGLHPLAVESVYQSLSSVYDNQVFIATHSPILLTLAEPKNLLCFARLESGAIDVVRGERHPRLSDWKKGIDISTLYASGLLQ